MKKEYRTEEVKLRLTPSERDKLKKLSQGTTMTKIVREKLFK
jgi:hypothetical protein